MIVLGEALLSDDLLSEQFVCNLEKCKGACCVQGDRGAPLSADDVRSIQTNLENIRPFMSDEGRAHLDAYGFSETDEDGEEITTCLPTGECSFVVYEKNGLLSCAIEKAHKAGESDYLKPLSCHLYPVRIAKYGIYDAVNYHRWDICSDACTLGKSLKVPVYKFAKAALERKFGSEWYLGLEALAEQLGEKKKELK